MLTLSRQIDVTSTDCLKGVNITITTPEYLCGFLFSLLFEVLIYIWKIKLEKIIKLFFCLILMICWKQLWSIFLTSVYYIYNVKKNVNEFAHSENWRITTASALWSLIASFSSLFSYPTHNFTVLVHSLWCRSTILSHSRQRDTTGSASNGRQTRLATSLLT